MIENLIPKVDAVITLIVNIGCLIIIAAMIDWWRRLHNIRSYLRPLIISIINIKCFLWLWSVGVLLQYWFDLNFPVLYLIGRFFIMCGVLTQVWVVFHYRRRV